MRKLATIQRIKKVESISNADNIEVASVLGWKVVVKKGEFKQGDPCVYCEIDSVLPDKPEFEFLKSHNFRIRTVKLKGQVSQGICFPLSILPVPVTDIGADVTDLLSIKKHECPAATLYPDVIKGDLPGFLYHTDLIRLQSSPQLVEEIQKYDFYISEKIDGVSATFYLREGVFGVCSHKSELKEREDSIYWKIARQMCSYHLGGHIQDIEGILRSLDQDAFKFWLKRVGIDCQDDYAIQGEIAGPGIQKNRLGLSEKKLFIFDLYNITKGRYEDFDALIGFCGLFNLNTVPIIGYYYEKEYLSLDDFMKVSQRKSIINDLVDQEGIVVKAVGSRLRFKLLNNNYLIKNKE